MRFREIIETPTNPAFAAWFGKSQVVDVRGRPLKVYHGTPNAGFDTFADEHKGRRTKHAPKDVGYHFTDDPEFADAYSGSHEIRSHNVFTQMFGREPNIEPPPNPALYPVYLSVQNPLRLRYSKEINAQSNEQAKRAGHDGIVADHGTGTEYVVFHPAQIKSAVGNRGSYDPASEKITEAEAQETGGAVQLEGLSATSLSGQKVPILKNPSPDVLLNRLKRTHGLRGILLDNDLFWANSYSLIHVQISKAVGIAGYGDARLELTYRDGKPHLLILPAHDETYDQVAAVPAVARLRGYLNNG